MSTVTASNTYLNFEGNCREAMNFYKDCLGGTLHIMDFKGSPMKVPPGAENNVLHSNLNRDGIHIMASDCMPGQKLVFGNNFAISINCGSKEQADLFYGKLVAGGKEVMALQTTFWGAYFGMLTDKFGVNWMFNYDEPKK